MLLLAIFALALLLAVFTYQIITTPVAAVDAPTLLRSGAAPAPPAEALPDAQRGAPAFPPRGGGWPGGTGDDAAPPTGPALRASPRKASSGRLGSGGLAVLAIGGLIAGIIGGWMLHLPARGATACSPHAIQICSQGSVVLTGSQLAGAAIAVVGVLVVVIAGVLATR